MFFACVLRGCLKYSGPFFYHVQFSHGHMNIEISIWKLFWNYTVVHLPPWYHVLWTWKKPCWSFCFARKVLLTSPLIRAHHWSVLLLSSLSVGLPFKFICTFTFIPALTFVSFCIHSSASYSFPNHVFFTMFPVRFYVTSSPLTVLYRTFSHISLPRPLLFQIQIYLCAMSVRSSSCFHNALIKYTSNYDVCSFSTSKVLPHFFHVLSEGVYTPLKSCFPFVSRSNLLCNFGHHTPFHIRKNIAHEMVTRFNYLVLHPQVCGWKTCRTSAFTTHLA